MQSVGTRKISGSLIKILLLSIALVGCKAHFEQLGMKIEIDRRVMSNGLQVLMIEDHSVPVVSYQTWFRVGSVDEKFGATGLAHLFEHLMFKGTEKYGAKQFFTQLEAKGAEVNAYTTRDHTVYYENFISELLPKVIDMEADRMTGLILNPDVVNTERMVVLEERKMRTDNSPAGKIQEALWALAYRVHPYHWPTVGYEPDVMQVPVEAVQEFYRRFYQPVNAVLIIAGDFDPDMTYSQIEKAYGAIPKGKKNTRADIPAEPEQKEEHRLVLRDQVASELLAIGYHITAAENDDSYAIDVLSNILFNGNSSRAHQLMVEKKDLVIGVSGASFTPLYPGLLMISTAMKGNAPAEDAEKLLDQLIREIQEKGVTQEEVQIAVKQLTVQLVDSIRSSFGIAQLLGAVMMVFDDHERLVDDLNKYLKVTPEDVKKAAAKYLVPNNRSVVIMKSEKKP